MIEESDLISDPNVIVPQKYKTLMLSEHTFY